MVTLFGISLYTKSKEQLKHDIENRINQGERVTIATVNPEILLRASRDKHFKDVLNKCTFRVIDGFGISFAMLIKTGAILKRITGRMVVATLYHIAQEKNFRVGIVGGRGLTAMRATDSLQKRYADTSTWNLSIGAEVEVSDKGVFTNGLEKVKKNIKSHPVDIMLLGFGAPKQEYIMTSDDPQISARIQAGIGGLLDVYAGKLQEPPQIFLILGLEWVWRVFQEPKRFTRIINAVIVFTFKAIKDK